jgi:hypothetical protein
MILIYRGRQMTNEVNVMRALFVNLCAVVIIAITATTVSADYVQRQKLMASDAGAGDQFGYAVAISGNTMVVGSRHDTTTAGGNAGSAYVFVLTNGSWTQQAKLLPSDGLANDEFGFSVAISENTIVVGSYHADAPLSNGGAAYVFVRSGTAWSQQQKITAADGTADDQFGVAVAITGEVIVVGANHADLPGNSEAGAAYVFLRTGTVWALTQRLSPSLDVLLGDHFGDAVASGGNKIVIGASGDDTPQTSAGAVYVFVETGAATYAIQQKLTIGDGTNGDQFGFSVGFDGTTIVGGAKEDSTVVGQTAIGAAYVFTFNGASWSLQQKLVASDGAAFDRFGWSVAVTGDTVAVGAREDDTAVGGDAGSTYIFSRTGTVWTQQPRLNPLDPFNGDRFGGSVAFGANGLLAVGAPEKQIPALSAQGVVYTFAAIPRFSRADFDGDGKTDLSIFRADAAAWFISKSDGSGSLVRSWGVPSDIPTPGDFDGDGKADIAVYRPSSGQWFILRSSDLSLNVLNFGVAGDKPVAGDYDGDGKADVAIYRPSQGVWYVFRSSDNGVSITTWGGATDTPIAADYDGDGLYDVGVYRPSTGQWFIYRTTLGPLVIGWGVVSDKPVEADYDGDHKADVAIYRPSDGRWYIYQSSNNSVLIVAWGISTDVPAPGDYDGDGKYDIAVFRDGTWFVFRSTGGALIATWGAAGDVPIPARYIP